MTVPPDRAQGKPDTIVERLKEVSSQHFYNRVTGVNAMRDAIRHIEAQDAEIARLEGKVLFLKVGDLESSNIDLSAQLTTRDETLQERCACEFPRSPNDNDDPRFECAYHAKLRARVAERDKTIEGLNAEIAKRDERIAELESLFFGAVDRANAADFSADKAEAELSRLREQLAEAHGASAGLVMAVRNLTRDFGGGPLWKEDVAKNPEAYRAWILLNDAVRKAVELLPALPAPMEDK